MNNPASNIQPIKKTALQAMSERLSVDPVEMKSMLMQTVMPAKTQVSDAEFLSFVIVANRYGLDPLVKEIYAYPKRGGGIQPIVGVDGWLKIIRDNNDFDGMTLEDLFDGNGNITAVKCSIFRKSCRMPTEITEYMAECRRPTEPWKQMPNRMLRHKAAMQCGRYAFGISGIMDEDDAQRYSKDGVIDYGNADRVEPKKSQRPANPFAEAAPEKPVGETIDSDTGEISPNTNNSEVSSWIDKIQLARSEAHLKKVYTDAYLWGKENCPEGCAKIERAYFEQKDTLGFS